MSALPSRGALVATASALLFAPVVAAPASAADVAGTVVDVQRGNDARLTLAADARLQVLQADAPRLKRLERGQRVLARTAGSGRLTRITVRSGRAGFVSFEARVSRPEDAPAILRLTPRLKVALASVDQVLQGDDTVGADRLDDGQRVLVTWTLARDGRIRRTVV